MKINAHVPTQQYGFIELTDLPDDPKEIERIYNKYAETPIRLASGNRVELEAFVGGKIFYDDEKHEYTNEAGEVYLSGSQYAESFEKPFDKVGISQKMAKNGVKAEDIVAMWELAGEVSRTFGTAIHAALELYNTHRGSSEALEREYHIHSHPIIKKAVQSFYALHKEDALSEVLVVDHAAKRAGQIDRLVIVDKAKKIARVEDYKTNATIEKDLPKYWKQLGFYSDIMRADGWTMQPEVIHHWDGEWHRYTK